MCGLFLSLSLFSRARARVSEHCKVALSENLSHRGCIQNRGKEQERETTPRERKRDREKERKQKQTEQKIKRKRERDVREKKRERREKQKRARRPKKRERARERLLCFRARDVHERTRCALPLLQHVLRFTIIFSPHATHDACT